MLMAQSWFLQLKIKYDLRYEAFRLYQQYTGFVSKLKLFFIFKLTFEDKVHDISRNRQCAFNFPLQTNQSSIGGESPEQLMLSINLIVVTTYACTGYDGDLNGKVKKQGAQYKEKSYSFYSYALTEVNCSARLVCKLLDVTTHSIQHGVNISYEDLH